MQAYFFQLLLPILTAWHTLPYLLNWTNVCFCSLLLLSSKVGRALTYLATEFGLSLDVGDAAAACSRLKDTFTVRLHEDEGVSQQNLQHRASFVHRGRGPLPGEAWGFEAPSPSAVLAGGKTGATTGGAEAVLDGTVAAEEAATAYAGVPLSKHRRELDGLWSRLSELRGDGDRGQSAVDACLAQVRWITG